MPTRVTELTTKRKAPHRLRLQGTESSRDPSSQGQGGARPALGSEPKGPGGRRLLGVGRCGASPERSQRRRQPRRKPRGGSGDRREVSGRWARGMGPGQREEGRDRGLGRAPPTHLFPRLRPPLGYAGRRYEAAWAALPPQPAGSAPCYQRPAPPRPRPPQRRGPAPGKRRRREGRRRRRERGKARPGPRGLPAPRCALSVSGRPSARAGTPACAPFPPSGAGAGA
ncbi:uncharacterized protein LOC144581829 [Callithrix jacchus]